MKKLFKALLILISSASLSACNHRHQYTVRLKSGLFVECYSTGIIGNLSADYLTDSVSFRKYIGTFDDEQGYFYYQCRGDSILVEKKEQDDDTGEIHIVSKRLYLLTDLKR